MINSLINKFVPFRLLPKRTRVIRYLEITFEKSTGENLKNTFKENGYTASQIEQVFDSAFKQYGDKIDALMMSNDQIALERESLPAMAFILDKALIVKPRDFQLDDYEKGLERQYEELQEKKGTDNSQARETGPETMPHAETNSKIPDPCIIRCQNCDQSLNVPKGKKLKVSCPKCGHSWVYDGTSKIGDTWSVEKNSPALKGGILIEHIGIETKGGILTPLLNSGSKAPCQHKQIFSTAEDMQAAVSIKLYRGLAETIDETVFLGQYDFPIKPPAPCGVPQIEITVSTTEEDIWISARNMI